MEHYNIVIIGGGPAGLAAAAAAKKAGEDSILILERDQELGGILNQCIHNGFGLHTFKEELTGPEYAGRFITEVKDLGIEYRLNTMVLSISSDRIVTAMNRTDGMFQVKAQAVILAMGCRERPRGALNIPGYRPAGIYTAGTAQRLVNIEGFMPGKEVVILGSGDIGLIMARRMTLEGAKVKVVAELMPYSGGLKRNIVQCLDDFGIPLKLSHTVVDIEGKDTTAVIRSFSPSVSSRRMSSPSLRGLRSLPATRDRWSTSPWRPTSPASLPAETSCTSMTLWTMSPRRRRMRAGMLRPLSGGMGRTMPRFPRWRSFPAMASATRSPRP